MNTLPPSAKPNIAISEERAKKLRRELNWRLLQASRSVMVALPNDLADRRQTLELWVDLLAVLNDYEKARPLIEAAMGAGIMTTKDGAGISFNFFTNEDDKRSILRAALALREEKK